MKMKINKIIQDKLNALYIEGIDLKENGGAQSDPEDDLKFQGAAFDWYQRVVDALRNLNNSPYFEKFVSPNSIKLTLLEEQDASGELMTKTRFIKSLEALKEIMGKIEKDNQSANNNHNTPRVTPDGPFELTFTPNGALWVNDTFELAKVQLGKDNDHFFGYIFGRSENTITVSRNDIKNEYSSLEKYEKDFNDILHQTGFTGNIRATFFPRVTKNTALFRKRVTKEQLEKDQINTVELIKELKIRHSKPAAKKK